MFDLVISWKTTDLAAGVFEDAIDGDVELAGFSGLQLEFADSQFLEACPHTEGLRLVASSAAEFDQDLHAAKVEGQARAIKGDAR